MTDEPRVVLLTDEQSTFVDELVERGDYKSADEVIRAGVEVLQDREKKFRFWLEKEVLPVVDAMEADPSRAIPAEKVFADLRARHAARFKSGK